MFNHTNQLAGQRAEEATEKPHSAKASDENRCPK